MRQRCITATMLFLFLAPIGFADLDVNVPPGTPIEWTKQLPSIIFTRDFSTTKRPGGDATTVSPLDGGTDVSPANTGSVFSYTMITTPDITGHLQWVNKHLPTQDEGGIDTGKKSHATWDYPPPITNTLHWMTLAPFLRKMLHPSLVSESEAIEYLIEFGYPSLSGAYAASGQKSISDMTDAVIKQVPPIPAKIPSPKHGKTVFETMINEFVAMELTSEYPYNPNRDFCRHLNAIDDLCLSAIIDYTKNTHLFLRQNAIYTLGNYSKGDVAPHLRELLLKSKSIDPVSRNRALSALIRRKDTAIVADLCKALKSDSDPYFQCYVAYALGVIGDPSGVKPLTDELKDKKNRDNPDFLWSAIPALARLRSGDKKVVDLLKDIRKDLEGNLTKFDQQPTLPPDRPDPPGTKGTILVHMTILALANMGDQGAIDELLKLLEPPPPPAGAPNQRAGRVQNITSHILSSFKPPLYYLVMDVLPNIGEKGMEKLKALIADNGTDVMLRSYALNKYWSLKPEMETLKSIADTHPIAMRALAATLAIGTDDKYAEETARKVLDDYIKSPAALGADYAAISAMQTLGRLAVLKPPKITEVVDIAIKTLPPKEVAQPPAPPAPGQPGQPGPGQPQVGRQGGPGTVTVNMPVLENAITELGYLHDAGSVQKLADILKGTSHRGRGEAALALGEIGGKEALTALVAALEDKDGWIRMCAFLSLRKLSGKTDKDFEHDWLFPAKGEQEKGVKVWKTWLESKG